MRVVIAEDLALLRDGLVRLLTAHGCTVVEAVDNGPMLVNALVRHRPDVSVIDVRLPPGFTDEGLRAALEARRRVPGLPVLILSQYVEQLYARELLSDRSGGVGYLLKDRVGDVGRFVDAVRQVAAGGTAMDPEVLTLMAEGMSNLAIAARFQVTDKAIGKHTNNIFAKLGLPPSDDHNRRVMAVLAYLQAAPAPPK
ncbi:response regulator transcription factor [Nonomuraea sp. NPDC048892]|uniref:response regulator transcription factor n=1 Tax=Nonomuraea sp. NPDC048892 TaxID=3154624 RepID=UPI0033D43234